MHGCCDTERCVGVTGRRPTALHSSERRYRRREVKEVESEERRQAEKETEVEREASVESSNIIF